MKGFITWATFVVAAVCQDASPTITLGPRSNYQQPPAASVTASGDHLEIFPEDFSNGIPDEGIDIAFGPDLQAAMTSAFEGVCADGYSQECSDELSKVLDTGHSYTVESRVVGIDDLLVIGGVALLSIIIEAVVLELHNADQGTPVSVVNIPATDLAQIQSQTASTAVIATGSDAYTITAAPTATISSATITTLTADQDSHSSGDIIITLPTAAAEMMEELIYKSDVSGECVNIQLLKRQSGGSLSSVNNVVDFVLPFVPPQQLLAALGVEVGQNLPRIIDTAQQASLEAAQAFAAGLPEFADLDAAFRDVLAETAWLGVLTWCGQQINDLHELVLKAGEYVEDPNDPGEDEGECPADAPKGKDAPLCKSDDCKGSQGTCSTGDYKGCTCLAVVTPYWQSGDEGYWSGAQFVLQGLLSELGWGCDQENRITLETDDFEGLATAFCKDVDLTSSVSKDISPSDAGFSGYEDYTFTFSWEKKEDETCVASCTDIYTAFTSNNVCSYDQHTKVTNGYQDFTCGTATFNITKGDEQPSDPGDDEGTYVDLGLLNCGTRSDQGNANYFTTLETMNKAAEWFCETQVEAGLRWTPGEVSESDALVEVHVNSLYYDPMYVTANWIDNAGCPTLDFGGDNAESMNATCKERFGTIINRCDTSNNDKHWWKQGGTFFRDCVEWSITRDDFLSEKPTDSDDWRPDATYCTNDDDCGSFGDSCTSGNAYCVLAADSWCSCSFN